MDNGLVLDTATGEITFAESLNPYCSGQWSRTARQIADATNQTSLNPYCSGQWSRTYSPQRHVCSSDSLNPYCSGQWSRTIITISSSARNSGLNPYCSGQWSRTSRCVTFRFQAGFVLILIVVDNGLVPSSFNGCCSHSGCLNPYCSGQWSRTRPYKTLLIINKLKSFTKQIFTFLNRKLTIS